MRTIKEQAEKLIETAKENGVDKDAIVSQEQAELIIRITSIGTSIRAIATEISKAYESEDYAEADRLQLAKETMMQIQSETESLIPVDKSLDFLDSVDFNLDIID